MKRVKMMLASFALLAVVGGALAFKAKFESTFCYTLATSKNGVWTCSSTDAAQAPLTCNSFTQNRTTEGTPPASQPFCTQDLTPGRNDCKKQNGVDFLDCLPPTKNVQPNN